MAKIEIELGTQTNSCFVIMPFAPTFQTEYERIIRPAVEAAGLESIRADEIYSKPQVTSDIWKNLRRARVVVAELTGKNTNVFYEVGLAHALGKPVIIITRNDDDVPFDLKALRYLYYNIDDPFWGENLKTALTDMLRSLLKEADYGTVFEDISLPEKIEYVKKKVTSGKVEVQQKYDVSGVWQGKMIRSSDGQKYDLALTAIQKDSKMSGTLITSFNIRSTPTIIRQSVAGTINGDTISFYSVSYSYLQQGNTGAYYLDNFSGKISSNGNEISGKWNDEKFSGDFSLERQAVE